MEVSGRRRIESLIQFQHLNEKLCVTGRFILREATRHYTTHCSRHFSAYLLDGLESGVSNQSFLL